MDNVFARKQNPVSAWDKLDKARDGRGNLGPDVPIEVFRAYTYTLADYLTDTMGAQECDTFLHGLGYRSGALVVRTKLDATLPPHEFFNQLKTFLRDNRVGVFRMETYDAESGDFAFTLREDLNYSGLTPTDAVSFSYDEGYFEGVMEVYTGTSYSVHHADSWLDEGFVCRFKGERS